MSTATDELQYLMDFTQAVTTTIKHLTHFCFCFHGEFNTGQEGLLSHTCKVWHQTGYLALQTAPLQLAILFPNNILKRSEEDIANYENKGHSSHSKGRYYLYERSDKKFDKRSNKPAWKNIGGKRSRQEIQGSVN